MGTTNHRPTELTLYLPLWFKGKKYVVRVLVEKAVAMPLLAGLVYPQARVRVSRLGNGYRAMGQGALQH